jgi:cell division septum initiation protein DivIVA
MIEEIKKKKDAIWTNVRMYGRSEGSVIATQKEVLWFLEQGACDGILITFRAAPEIWEQGKQCYYYYYAITLKADKEKLRMFADTYQLPSVSALNKLLPPAGTTNPDEQRVAENIKKIRRLKQASDRRRRQRKLEDEQLVELMEAERDECYEHRNDLNWLVARIESMGWEVTLRRKQAQECISKQEEYKD